MSRARLTPAQIDMLEQAYHLTLRSEFGIKDQGWFEPSKHESADVIGLKRTCKALCRKGLMEYKVIFDAVGKLPEILSFRITYAGMQCFADEYIE
jgi:hypothetical protein